MTYPELLKRLISFIPADIYQANKEKITELADGIAAESADAFMQEVSARPSVPFRRELEDTNE